MKHSLALVAALSLMSSAALAQNTPSAGSSTSGSSNMKLSMSECTNLWQQAGGSSSAGLTEAQAKNYVTDFKAANPDGDTTIDQSEFMAACNKGLVKSSSSSGASTGTSGASSGSSSGSSTKPSDTAK